jgi:hypothetical protein
LIARALAIIGLTWPFLASGATWSAATCSLADVQIAYNAATDGDTVSIPGGACTWNAALTINKGVAVIGAGIGSTILTGARFEVTVPTGKGWRVSGMTINGTAGFSITGYSKVWRIDNIRFDSVSGWNQGRIIWVNPGVGGYTAGVIDHNYFYDPRTIQIHHREERGGGNDSYLRPLDLGGPDALYIEDNTFEQLSTSYNVSAPATDCDGGGRLVVRHNTLKNQYLEMHDAIVEGLRSCRKWEFYENTWTTTQNELNTTGQYAQIALRGGTGVVYNNSFAASTGSDIVIALYRTYESSADPWSALCSNGSGKFCGRGTTAPIGCTTDLQCGGETGACIKLDGSATSPNGYPCRDQMGWSGNNPQFKQPALFWNNKAAGVQIGPRADGATDFSYLAPGVDYCSAASRPGTCGGVGTNYAPYRYPHPIVSGTQVPRPPSGGSVN